MAREQQAISPAVQAHVNQASSSSTVSLPQSPPIYSTDWVYQDFNPVDLESRIHQINQPFFPGIKEPIDDEN